MLAIIKAYLPFLVIIFQYPTGVVKYAVSSNSKTTLWDICHPVA